MKNEIPIWKKQNLTIEEAAKYSNIGENRLSILLKEPGCKFLLKVGNKRLIKRQAFDEYMSRCSCI